MNELKVTVKTFIMLQKILFQINAVLLNFLFIKNPEKKRFPQKYEAVFNIANNQKCLLSSKSSY